MRESAPVRKRASARFVRIFQKLVNPLAALEQLFEQSLELALIGLIPLPRDLLPRFVNHLFRKMANQVEPGLKAVERSHIVVNAGTKVEPLYGRVFELPPRAAKGEPVVDHLRKKALPLRRITAQRSPPPRL